MRGMGLAVLLSVLFCAGCSGLAWAGEHSYMQVEIVTGARAGAIERRCAALLQERVRERAQVAVQVHQEPAPGGPGLSVLLGLPEHHDGLARYFAERRIPPLTPLAPGPEGFLLRSFADGAHTVVLAAGIDERGVLYAVGELLRQITFQADSITLPATLDVRSAPAFEVRGTQYGQSGIARRLGKVREWTQAEQEREILDEVLTGANTFDTDPGPICDFLQAWGLQTQLSYGPNTGSGPPEWEAKESIGRVNYLCPSAPAARQHLLDTCEATFKNSPDYDFVKLVGGDGGGCECDKCDPYGLTFIKLCEEMAAIIHKYHPKTRIWFTNQKFDDADDQAIFKYLQEQPRDWLWAWGYGPGSDAMGWQPGHRQTHRMDLFRYPGFGPFDRYNQEIIHQLPPQQTLLHYNEITHWRYSQHGYMQMYPRADRNGDQPPWWNHCIYERRPDAALTMVYDRLTFYAWPRFYHWVFGEVNRYGAGDITHSSGNHDHFNQWMWQRLLWAPQTSVEEVVDEYCRAWFGPEVAPLMAEAIFQLEENLEEEEGKDERSQKESEDNIPEIVGKTGIERYYGLVQEAGKRMPPQLLAKNWLWREYMQKAALDLHTKLAVEQQIDLQQRVEKRVSKALQSGNIDRALDQVLTWFRVTPANGDLVLPRVEPATSPTARMRALREEAGRLGEESNALYGVRSEGYYNLDHDFIGLGWLKRQLERARAAQDEAEQRELLRMIVAYEDAGPGGSYDDLGTYGPCPHAVNGYPYDHGQPYVYPMLDEGNRASQKSLYFTQNEAQGVTLHYSDLDPGAQYRIRFTLVRPWYQERYAMRMNQKSETIYVDEQVLARDLELPLQMSDFFTFEVPRDATADGELEVRFEKAADVAAGDRVTVEQWRNSGGWGTLVSEAWLMKE